MIRSGAAERQYREQITGGLYREIIARTSGRVAGNQPLVVFTGMGDVNPALFQYWALRDSANVRFLLPAESDNPAMFEDSFARADLVIASDPHNPMLADRLVSSHIQDQVLANLRSRADFREVAQFRHEASGRRLYLFQHVRP